MNRTTLTQSTILKLNLSEAVRPLDDAQGSEALALLRRIAHGQS